MFCSCDDDRHYYGAYYNTKSPSILPLLGNIVLAILAYAFLIWAIINFVRVTTLWLCQIAKRNRTCVADEPYDLVYYYKLRGDSLGSGGSGSSAEEPF